MWPINVKVVTQIYLDGNVLKRQEMEDIGSNGPPVGIGLWRIDWSRNRWRNEIEGPKCSLPQNVHWVGQYAPLELFWLWTKVHQISFPQPRRGCGWSSFFQMFYMAIHSGEIRDRSRKLSEIAPKFGSFLALPNFRGGPSKNCTHIITPPSRHVIWKSFVRELPLAAKF